MRELIQLSEIISVKGGKRLPKGHDLITTKTEHKYLRARDIKDGKINFNQPVYISDETYKIIKNYIVNKGELILTIAGTIGEVALVSEEFDKSNLTENAVKIKVNEAKVSNVFLKYYLKSKSVYDYFQLLASGAAQPKLGIYKILSTKINLPPLPTQQRIAEILSGYDDLIENNLKRIKILEEMAQQTFIDFTQSQNKKNWESVALESIIDFHIGGGWGEEELSDDFSEAGYVIRGTDIDPLKKGDYTKVPFRYHKKSNIKSRSLNHGDIVFEVSGGSSNEGVAKSLLITDNLLNVFNQKVICASFCKLLRPTDNNVSYYLFYFLNYLREVKLTEIYEKRSASNIVNYNWEAFLKYQKIIIPSERELLEFNNKIIPIKSAVINLGIQNQRLREARDILLPRLMMGMIEV